MEINRIWEMPSIWTFQMKSVQKILNKYVSSNWVDPFAGKNSPAEIKNDIEELNRNAQFHMDGYEFLQTIESNSIDGGLFDPPYSVEQCLRRYTPKHKGTAGRAEYWAKCKNELGRVIKKDGINISFGWDSCGIGKKRGFEIIEVLLICHGACHNDTIVTVEKKIK